MRHTFRIDFIKQSILLFGILCLSIWSVNAQQLPLDSLKTDTLADAVITGEYGENSLHNSVNKIRMIDSKRMMELGAINVKDVLQNELNIRITQDPSLGSALQIQGIGGQSIKILIDGVPVIGREGGNIDLNQLNLNNVERIEIIEGPMSVNYGTDALGGIINIITKKPLHNQVSYQGSLFYQSNGQYNADAGVNIGGKKQTFSIRAGRNYFDGFDEHESVRRFRTWKPNEQYMVDWQYARTTSVGRFRFQQMYFREKVTDRDNGNITPFGAYGLDKYYRTQRLTNVLYFDKKLNKNRNINIVASYSHYQRTKNTYRKDLVTLEEEIAEGQEHHDTNLFHAWMSRGTYSKNLKGAKFNYQVGYELNYESTHGSKILNETQSVADYAVFGSFEYKPHNRITLRPGLRYSYNTRFDAPVIPSLNIKLDITSYLKLRASYSRGFRAPSLKEMYLAFVDPSHNVHGNPNLNAEKSENVQIFFSYEASKDKHVFRVEPGVYYNHIQNLIDLSLSNTSNMHATYINVGEFTGKGFMINTEYRTPIYYMQFGYVINGRHNAYSPDESYFYNNEYRFNTGFTWPKKQTTFSFFYKFNGKFQTYQFNYMNNNVELGYINSFALMDATISQPLLNKRLHITIGAKNLLDIKDIRASMSGGVHQTNSGNALIAMGRIYFVALRFQLTQKFFN